MDLGTIFGIVSLAIQVVSSVDKAIALCEQIQAAPKELQDFRSCVVRFKKHFSILKTTWEQLASPSPVLEDDDLREIQDTLKSCESFFAKQADAHSTLRAFRAAFSTSANIQELNRLKTMIDGHYSRILVPFYLHSILESR